MQKIMNFADTINEWTGRIFSFTLVILAAVVVIEVILRKGFNSPTIWSFDLSKHLFAFLFMIVAGYTLLHEGHVAIDIFSKHFSERTQAKLEIISYLLFFFPFWLVVLWEGTKFAAMSWQILETGWGLFPIPLYPIKTIIPLTALLLCLQGLATLIRKILILKNTIAKGDQ